MQEMLQNNFALKSSQAFNAAQNLTRKETAPASLNNRLDALKVLSHSILREIDSLRQDENAVSLTKIDLSCEVQRFEADLIRCALLRTGGKQRQAARLLNVKISTLNAKIKRFNITANGLSQLS
jgi:transcriptional regulator with GAF, ATPase, and Fis domain